MLGLEEYYISLLNEAKSPEEIKKILEYQFVQGKGVPQEILDSIFEVDPTKKKSYTRWVLSQWPEYENSIRKSIEDGKLKRMFDTIKNRENSGLDLGRMKNFDEAISMIPDIDPILEKEGDPNAPENDFDIVYTSEDGSWVVVRPHTYQADIKLGKGCRWCTAGAFGMDRAEYYWNIYSEKGPIWINFDKSKKEIAPVDKKEYPYTRYQFCFEANNGRGELMNSNDDRVSLHSLGIPEDVAEFYGTQNPRYKEAIDLVDPDTLWREYEQNRENMARQIVSCRDGYGGLYLLPERNDNRNLEDVPWHVYRSDDFGDPISNIEYDPDDCVELTNSEDGLVILRTPDGEYYAYHYRYEHWHEYKDVYFSTIRNAWGLSIVKLGDYDVFLLPTDEEDGESSSIGDGLGDVIVDNEIIAAFANMQIPNEMEKAGDPSVGTYVEIVWGDGTHSLVFKSMSDSSADVLIKKDYPNDEDKNQFTAHAIDGKVLISARILEYNILEDEGRLSVTDDLSEMCGRPVYIISYDNGSHYNVYDGSTKKMYFNEPSNQIETVRIGQDKKWYLRCTVEYGAFIASITDGEVLTPTYEVLTRAGSTSSLLIGIKNANVKAAKEIFVLRFLGGKCKTFGPFHGYTPLDSDTRISVTVQPGIINILNTDTGNFVLPENQYTMIGPLHHGPQEDDGMIILQNKDGKLSLCNYDSGQIILDDIDLMGERGYPVRPKMDKNGTWKIRLSNGTYNLVNNKRVVLPKSVESVEGPYYNDLCTFYLLGGENKFWILDVSKHGAIDLLPTTAGIPANFFKLVEANGFEFRFKCDINGDECLIRYLPISPDVHDRFKVYLNLPEGFKEITSNRPVYNEIYSNFFPTAAAVRENFNRTLKMINDFYKDK